ncbi:MAG TPA: hypothetical protein PLM59_07960 [Oscillospiraceae bacterium]|nr:hypothetical protein [Oscillospiraceae bacterium]MDN5378103.1 hypothetical protein [Clostridiales bacterium]HOV41710.1 hypothetical protein [Oscillospiraceae bacterium]
MSEKTDFFTYKGFPLVRNKDTIYYGNMSDDYVVMIQVLESKKVGNMEVASKVKVYQVSTDESKNPVERIAKVSEKNGLYEALDIAYIWLSKTARN